MSDLLNEFRFQILLGVSFELRNTLEFLLCSSSCVLPCVAPYPNIILFFFSVSYDLYVFTFSLFPELYPYYQSFTFSIYSVFYVFRFHILNCLLFTLLLNSMCVYAFSQKRKKKKENTKSTVNLLTIGLSSILHCCCNRWTKRKCNPKPQTTL